MRIPFAWFSYDEGVWPSFVIFSSGSINMPRLDPIHPLQPSPCFAATLWSCGAIVLLLGHGSRTGVAADSRGEFFEKRIRPVLVESCYECHGPDTDVGEANLRLDSLAGMIRGGRSGPAIVRGDPDRSLLIHALNHDPTVTAMPPDDRLDRTTIAAFRHWIESGAAWPSEEIRDTPLPSVTQGAEDRTPARSTFWAFLPPRQPAIPEVGDRSWIRSPIDAFVLSRLESHGLAPAPPADRRTLIRRATYDLLGLPPTPSEVAAFLEDQTTGAFGRVIDRLLASPRYGERWGRHWLDVARYSDSNGMDDNIAYADAWRYRDYVISAFNGDKPFDRFVAEQLAGDLISSWQDPNRQESVIATTFLMLGAKMPSADDPIKQQLDIVDEQLDATSRAFMALTITCARCHDHKFDPLSMRDYYGLAGIFRSTRSMLGYRVDSKFNLTALQGKSENKQLSVLETELDRHDDALVNGNKLDMSQDQRTAHTTGKQRALEQMAAMPTAMAVEEGVVADMSLLLRGNHLTPSKLVPRAVPAVIGRGAGLFFGETESGRHQLVRWLIDPGHPLTSRVIVNRVWHWHYGRGIVPSVDNFGRLGARPDNQPLLDWLAVQFVNSGWSIKQLHRLLMDSNSYRMRVLDTGLGADRDPENRLLWQMNRRRLEAEEIRDSLLAVAGELDLSMGGSLLPIRNHKIMSTAEIQQCNAAHDEPRRTVYLPVIRSGLHDFLQTFDFPDPSAPTGIRNTTTVAPQALYMLNSPLVSRSARRLAEWLLEGARSTEARIERAYELLLSRTPTVGELERWRVFLDGGSTSTRQAAGSGDSLSQWESICRVLLSSNEFLYIE